MRMLSLFFLFTLGAFGSDKEDLKLFAEMCRKDISIASLYAFGDAKMMVNSLAVSMAFGADWRVVQEQIKEIDEYRARVKANKSLLEPCILPLKAEALGLYFERGGRISEFEYLDLVTVVMLARYLRDSYPDLDKGDEAVLNQAMSFVATNRIVPSVASRKRSDK